MWGVAFSGKSEPIVSQEGPSGSQALTLLNELPEEAVPRANTSTSTKSTTQTHKQKIDKKELLSRKCF